MNSEYFRLREAASDPTTILSDARNYPGQEMQNFILYLFN